MPEIVPFRGIRFAEAKIPAGSQICPPYDVIDAAEHQTLLDHHEYNAVRIVLGDDPENPKGDVDQYRERGAMVRSWLEQGVLERDEEPGYYLYEFEYTNLHGHRASYRGVLGAAKAKPWGEGVQRHEEIRPKVVDDRLKLRRTSGVDTGVVQLVDQGLGAEIAPFFDTVTDPVLDAEDFRGDRHRMWVLSEPKAVQALRDVIGPRPSVVADGHHRYTTALRLGQDDDRPGAGYALTMIGELVQDGLTIEPTHRILHTESAEAAKALAAAIATGLDERSGERWSLEQVGAETVHGSTPVDLDQPTFARRIASAWEAEGEFEIENWHDLEGARARLAEIGDSALLCVLPRVKRDEFWKRCAIGEVFPPKTTYFEPKIGTGMVLRLIEEELS